MSGSLLPRRVARTLLGCLIAAFASAASAWPTKAVQMLIGFPAGGSADILARALAESLGKTLNQSFVVVNRDGAAGTIAMAATVNATDGHTLAFGPAGALVLQPHIKPVSYKLGDVVGVCQTFVNNYALVASPTSKYKTLRDVLNDPRAKTDGIPFGTGGLGSVPHLATLELGLQADAKMLAVPYRGDPPLAVALKGGEIELGTVSVGLAQTQGLRILGVFSPARLADAPAAPTMKEQGVPVVAQLFGGLYAPKSLPQDALRALERACKQAVTSEHYVQTAKTSQQEVVYRDSASFTKAIEAENKAFGDVIKKAKLKLD